MFLFGENISNRYSLEFYLLNLSYFISVLVDTVTGRNFSFTWTYDFINCFGLLYVLFF